MKDALIPQRQLIEHNPSVGDFGDCYRTAVAVILGLPAIEVPHVCEEGEKNIDDLDGLIAMRNWLRLRSLAISKSVFNGELSWVTFRDWMQKFNPDSAIIVTGRTSRGTNHCVVMVGGKVVCDPISGKADQEPFSGPALVDGEAHWWVEAITPALRAISEGE